MTHSYILIKEEKERQRKNKQTKEFQYNRKLSSKRAVLLPSTGRNNVVKYLLREAISIRQVRKVSLFTLEILTHQQSLAS